MAPKYIMSFHCVAGSMTLATRPARIPMQMASWLAVPSTPRSAVGAIYKDAWWSRCGGTQVVHTTYIA